MKRLFWYLQEEHKRVRRLQLPNPAQLQRLPTPQNAQTQGNGFDCGVFMCGFVDALLRDSFPAFDQVEMTRYQ